VSLVLLALTDQSDVFFWDFGTAHMDGNQPGFFVCLFWFWFFVVLGLELRADTLSHSTSPFYFFVKGFLR
jgi:hypothetical protein